MKMPKSFSNFLISAASGPIRLFTPYKRRRKAQSEHGNDTMMSSGNGTTTVTITTPPIATSHNSGSSHLNNNTSIINNNQQTTQQIHIQTTPITNNLINNNNNTVTINNNGIKKKRFSVNIVNVKPSGADSSEDIETENISFTRSVTPAVKEESVQPWQTVTEAIQEIPADYAVDQSCKLSHKSLKQIQEFNF